MTTDAKCECGCGEKAPLATKSDRRRGYKKGEPVHFLPGHRQSMVLSGRRNGSAGASSPGLATAPEIDAALLWNLRGLPDEDAARVLDARARMLERATRRSFVELGLICLEMDGRMLWATLTHPETGVAYHSWDDWAVAALDVSRSSAYSAKKVLEVLEGIPLDDLLQIRRGNLIQLARASKKTRTRQDVLDHAKRDGEEVFVAWLNEHFPDEHLETKRKLLAEPVESAARQIEECFDAVRWVYDATSREDVMELLCAYFMDGQCEREGCNEQTNREAFATREGA